MEKTIYLTSEYKILKTPHKARFKLTLYKMTDDFNSIDIENIDYVGFEYKVIGYQGWYAFGDRKDLPVEDDDDIDIFSCDKWACRAPYFYFNDMACDINNGYGIGEIIINQVHIYEMVQNLFLKDN